MHPCNSWSNQIFRWPGHQEQSTGSNVITCNIKDIAIIKIMGNERFHTWAELATSTSIGWEFLRPVVQRIYSQLVKSLERKETWSYRLIVELWQSTERQIVSIYPTRETNNQQALRKEWRITWDSDQQVWARRTCEWNLIADKGGKSFIEPKLFPPFHSN